MYISLPFEADICTVSKFVVCMVTPTDALVNLQDFFVLLCVLCLSFLTLEIHKKNLDDNLLK